MPPHKLLMGVRTTKLLVHGQGVFLFKTTDPIAHFTFLSDDANNKLEVELSTDGIDLSIYYSSLNLKKVHKNKGLLMNPDAYYWFSVDSQNQLLYAGVGEPRLETVVYIYKFPESTKQLIKAFLESLTYIVIHEDSPNLQTLKLLRDPITATVPMLVKDMTTLTVDDVASGSIMPVPNLPPMSQKLYNCIAGPNFCIKPELYKAIEYSIATPGCWCYETLKKKSTEFNKDKPDIFETYLRITLGQNNGESPGIPYVMEIWPPGHFSPVHSHAGAEAVIRVLEGDINVKLYPFLSKDAEPFAIDDFVKGGVMWISPVLNQTHKLHNTGTATCITIQCYMYDGDDDKHYDYFDYLDVDGKIQQYEPDSDMDFLQFKEQVMDEWISRPRGCCSRRRKN